MRTLLIHTQKAQFNEYKTNYVCTYIQGVFFVVFLYACQYVFCLNLPQIKLNYLFTKLLPNTTKVVNTEYLI